MSTSTNRASVSRMSANAQAQRRAGGGFQTFALPAGQKIVVPAVFRGPPEGKRSYDTMPTTYLRWPTHVPNLNILRYPYGLDGPITFPHTPVCPQLRPRPLIRLVITPLSHSQPWPTISTRIYSRPPSNILLTSANQLKLNQKLSLKLNRAL